jgi:hypothetical protein
MRVKAFDRTTGRAYMLNVDEWGKRLCVEDGLRALFSSPRCYPSTDIAIAEVKAAVVPFPEPHLITYTLPSGLYVKTRRTYVVLGFDVEVVEGYVDSLGVPHDAHGNRLTVEGAGLARVFETPYASLVVGTGYVERRHDGAVRVRFIGPPADAARAALAIEIAVQTGSAAPEDVAVIRKIGAQFLAELIQLQREVEVLRAALAARARGGGGEAKKE